MPDYRNRPAPDAPRAFDISNNVADFLAILGLATVAVLVLYMAAVALGKAG